MDNILFSMLKRMGYVILPNGKEYIVCNKEGKTLEIIKEKENCNDRETFVIPSKYGNIYYIRNDRGDDSIRIKLNNTTDIYLDYHIGTNEYDFAIILDLRKNKQFDDDTKTFYITICQNTQNYNPGYIKVSKSHSKDSMYYGTEKLGIINQESTGSFADGKLLQPFNDSSRADDYVEKILKFISLEEEYFHYKSLTDAIDVIIPALYMCVDELLVFWQEHLDDYLVICQREKEKAIMERDELNKKISKYEQEEESLKRLIEKKPDFKKYSKRNYDNIHLYWRG